MAFEFSEEEKQNYLQVLSEGATPFDRFVARGDIEDVIDIQGSRKLIDRIVFRAITQTQLDQATRLIPIIGKAGSGKTHAFWAYKDKEKKIKRKHDDAFEETKIDAPGSWTIIYVPSPPAAIRIFLHVYTCIIDELGADILKVVAEKLVNKWGGKKKKHLGLFGSASLEDIIQAGVREFPGVYADCVKAFAIYYIDKERSQLAERWLLGEELDETDLETLQIGSVIEEDDICLAMIKIISEFTDETLVLYFDELESPYRMHGPDAERKFLETLKRLYNEVKNLVIIIAVLEDMWPRVLEVADNALISRMEPEQKLPKWKFDDVKLFFAKAMLHFWNSQNLIPPPDPLFPLNETILQAIYSKTDGNPRSIIKLIRIFVEKIVLGDMTIEELMKEEGIKPHAQKPLAKNEIDEEIRKMAETVAKTAEHKSNLVQKIEEMMLEEDFIIEVNPASVAGAALKSISIIGDKYGKNVEIEVESKFTYGKRVVQLAGLIKYNNEKIGLDVPAIKNFDRPGGVSAFYSANRLATALQLNIVERAILITSRGTKGQKYNSLLSQNPKIEVIEINHEEGEQLLRGVARREPSKIGKEIANIVFKDLPEEFE
ncbi:MAG: hypothetical protein ACTSRZ_07255 [Promethearchaeota archaeon]